MKKTQNSCWIAIALVVIAYERTCLSQTTQNVVNSTKSYITSDIDYETLSLFGVTPEFAEQFRINLIKAIEAEEKEFDNLRQGEFGGVSGGFYQGGGGTGQFGQGGGQGEDEEEEDEDTSPGPMIAGPGAFGVLSGLFGLFSGIGTLSPQRIIQSTVNFFPPNQRQMAQMIVDSLIGYTPPENRTSRPPTPRPRVTPTPLPLNMTDGDGIAAKANETEVAGSGNSEMASNSSSTNVELLSGFNSTSEMMPMSEAEVNNASVTSPPLSVVVPTTEGFVNVHKLINAGEASSTSLPNEDDEVDSEKKVAAANLTSSAYKVKLKVIASAVA